MAAPMVIAGSKGHICSSVCTACIYYHILITVVQYTHVAREDLLSPDLSMPVPESAQFLLFIAQYGWVLHQYPSDHRRIGLRVVSIHQTEVKAFERECLASARTQYTVKRRQNRKGNFIHKSVLEK